MVSLDDYLIVCNDFKGGMKFFFDYVRNRREILKTFNLSKIIEDFLVFSESIEMDVKELIKFYSFSTSLLYLKTQILYPIKLKDKKLIEREIVKKLINFSEKCAESKATTQNLHINVLKSSFCRENGVFLENVGNVQSYKVDINKTRSKTRAKRVVKKHDNMLCSNKFRSNVLGTYDAKILDKKARIIALLTKEDNFIFEFLLNCNDEFYFFERFCYFLVVLEYQMSNIIDLVYVNDELVLRKGKSIDEYKQQRD
ncbi:hypothetical protein baBA2_000127 [Borrelia anserina]|uniref:Cytosolic protein n=2 Tax=Borrelia anserina TaxID=143 RepID=A0ABN4UF74_BORAN|nr:hypothetical protein [Borrelia anserina]AHH08093.1 Putative cytosolic protein [Borrelia anserina BA2]AHH08900.1 Putative cytosolic protein [Borrelia anserina BA2]APR64638.1 hypothetical protein N187_00635 [Borrelia anserina Es]UPA06549.1 hypothetical protein baBA2_000127 [Borrelia anserina]